MPQEQRRWSQLPTDVVQLLADRLTDIVDRFSFLRVCSPWRSAAILINLPPQLPWLLFPPNPYADPHDPRHFFSLSKNRVFPLSLPSQTLFFTLGSYDGWLLATEPLSLLNPLSRTRFLLPSLRSSLRSEIAGARFCKPPNYSKFVVIVSFSSSSVIAFFESGAADWKYIATDPSLAAGDFTFYKDRILAFKTDGTISIISALSLEQVSVIPSVQLGSFYRRYLVESTMNGDLLLVVRTSGVRGKKFSVWKLEGWDEQKPEWAEVVSIGEDMVFVDNVHAICVSKRWFKRFRKSCIYYTDLYRICLYDIEDKRQEQLPCYWEHFPYPQDLQNAWWFLPRLC